MTNSSSVEGSHHIFHKIIQSKGNQLILLVAHEGQTPLQHIHEAHRESILLPPPDVLLHLAIQHENRINTHPHAVNRRVAREVRQELLGPVLDGPRPQAPREQLAPVVLHVNVPHRVGGLDEQPVRVEVRLLERGLVAVQPQRVPCEREGEAEGREEYCKGPRLVSMSGMRASRDEELYPKQTDLGSLRVPWYS